MVSPTLLSSETDDIRGSDSGFSSSHSDTRPNYTSPGEDENTPTKTRAPQHAIRKRSVSCGKEEEMSAPKRSRVDDDLDLEPLMDMIGESVDFEKDGTFNALPGDEVLAVDAHEETIVQEDQSVPRVWRTKQKIQGIELPGSSFPKSSYQGYTPQLPIENERIVLRTFMDREEQASKHSTPDLDSENFVSYKLDQFTIYNPSSHNRRPLELKVLSHLAVEHGQSSFLFDGIISDGHTRHYVQGAPFDTLSIGNYMDVSSHDVHGKIWIRSVALRICDGWYELGEPAPEYVRYFTPFFWLATFSKYFIDFVDYHQAEGVRLKDFKHSFAYEIKALHGDSEHFLRWYAEHDSDDFRQAVSVHSPFLFSQTYLAERKLCCPPICMIFDEVLHHKAIEPVPGSFINETVVTPFVYGCFEHMFGDGLKVVKPIIQSNEILQFDCVETPRYRRIQRNELGEVCEPPPPPSSIKRGDVLAISRDEVTKWKGKNALWYCYVTDVLQRQHGQVYDIIWLYSPEDTTCAGMMYPFTNELFFSDHCQHGSESILHEDVICKVSVDFMAQPEDVEKTGAEFFVRNKYREADSAFITLKPKDLEVCACQQPDEYIPSVGDTVLVESVRFRKEDKSVDVLEPAVVSSINGSAIEVRELARYSIDIPDQHRTRSARPNELVWTENIFEVGIEYIDRICHVKMVYEEDVIVGRLPKLYDQNGALDMFYISCYQDETGDLIPFKEGENFPAPFNSGTSPESAVQDPLRGLDLFCGGGNFGRGLEEGGAVRNACAVDIFSAALHTYKANLSDEREDTQLYLGSVNNFLKDAIQSKDGIPLPGSIDFISAGSPCQGFSNANQTKDSASSLRNCSLIASVVSFVDVYRPKYALLENVEGLAKNRMFKDHNGQGKVYNVFSQLLCSLVGMGYQVQQFLVDAWSHGSAQSRTRLFVSITAPGLTPQNYPSQSHEHPTFRNRSVIIAPNGKFIGQRQLVPCPFEMRTCKDIMHDLPRLHDNHVGTCIKYPDHRCPRICSVLQRQFMAFIPPIGGYGYFQACKAGLLPESLQNLYTLTKYRELATCASWSRLPEDGLCRTIVTAITPQCAFTGRWVHYNEPRLMTIMEARRVQSFPDDEVLVGTAVETFKIVGNSVDRTVARALGLSLRAAVVENIRKSL